MLTALSRVRVLVLGVLVAPAANAQLGGPPGDPQSGNPAQAPIEPAPNPWPDLPKFTQFANGLRICVYEDHSLPLVSVQLCFGVGSASDPPSRPGLCHVATKLLELRDDANPKLRALGVAATATTHRDYVSFASTCHPNLVERAIDAEAARLATCVTTRVAAGGSASPESETQSPKTRIDFDSAVSVAAWTFANEFERYDGSLERRALAALLAGHPYDDPPTFVAAAIGDTAVSEVEEFIANWFAPSNATLFIIGDVSEVRVLDHARRLFEALSYRDPPRPRDPPPLAADELQLRDVPWAYSGVDWLFLTPPLGAFDNAAIAVLLQRLGNPVDGLLASAVRSAEAPPLVVRHEAWRHCGIACLSLDEPPRGREADYDKLLRDALAEAAEKPASEMELNRARALAAAAAETRRASFRARAARLAEFEMVAGDILLAEYELPQIARVSVDDVRAAAAFLLNTRRVIIERVARQWCECETQHPLAPDESGVPGLAPLTPALCPPPPKWPDPAARLTQMAALSNDLASPTAGTATPQISKRTLANGVTAIACRVPGASRACVRTVLDGLPWTCDVGDVLMRVGSAARPAPETLDYLTYHGIDLHSRIEGRQPSLNALGPTELVPQMLEVQAELLQRPQRDPQSVRRELGRLAAVETPVQMEANPLLTRSERYYRRYFGDNQLLPTADEAAMELGILDSLPPPRIIVVGDVEPADALDAVARRWSDWPAVRPTSAPALPLSQSSTAASSPASRPAATWLFVSRAFLRRGILYSVSVPPILQRDAFADQVVDFIRTLLDAAPPVEHHVPRWNEWGGQRRFEQRLMFEARLGDQSVEAAANAIHERVAALRDGRLPAGEAEVALSLAAARRWLRLESVDAIADALEHTEGNPWTNAIPTDDAISMLRAIRDRRWVGRLTMSAYTCDAAARTRLESAPWSLEHQLRQDPADAPTAPATPKSPPDQSSTPPHASPPHRSVPTSPAPP